MEDRICRIAIFLSMAAMFFLYANVPSHANDDLKPRVPANKLSKVKELVNPVFANENSIAAGKSIYSGKGTCFNCHGTSGKGDGPAGAAFKPRPRGFTDIQWQKIRTDGEIFWAISEGTDYGMIPFGGMLSEEERWHLVNYIRELGGLKVLKPNLDGGKQ